MWGEEEQVRGSKIYINIYIYTPICIFIHLHARGTHDGECIQE